MVFILALLACHNSADVDTFGADTDTDVVDTGVVDTADTDTVDTDTSVDTDVQDTDVTDTDTNDTAVDTDVIDTGSTGCSGPVGSIGFVNTITRQPDGTLRGTPPNNPYSPQVFVRGGAVCDWSCEGTSQMQYCYEAMCFAPIPFPAGGLTTADDYGLMGPSNVVTSVTCHLTYSGGEETVVFSY